MNWDDVRLNMLLAGAKTSEPAQMALALHWVDLFRSYPNDPKICESFQPNWLALWKSANLIWDFPIESVELEQLGKVEYPKATIKFELALVTSSGEEIALKHIQWMSDPKATQFINRKNEQHINFLEVQDKFLGLQEGSRFHSLGYYDQRSGHLTPLNFEIRFKVVPVG